MKTPIKTRFAPSPTGLMHLGSLRTALFNYLYAKRHGGCFVLRIEDTDLNRSEIQYTEAILEGLRWLGLEWQEGPYYQSERQTTYGEYYERLEKSGHVYPCFCTEEELAITRKSQLAAGRPPRYPGTCRRLTELERSSKKMAKIPFTIRFEVADGQRVEFQDLIKGAQRFQTDHIGDFIIRRNDNSASFMFCNAIDDALMGVTHALRCDYHLTNTPRQILLLQALDLPVAQYGHFPTILGLDGLRLSKRNGSSSVEELREAGYLPLGILNYLSRLGHSDSDLALLDLETLCQHFELSRISHSPAHYDPAQLQYWQKASLHQMTPADCWQILAPVVSAWVPEPKINLFVEALQPNLGMPNEALPWAKALFGDTLEFSEEVLNIIIGAGPDFFMVAKRLLTEAPITFIEFLRQLPEKTGRKGKALFFPLRAALTAELHGPELVKILELLGIEKVILRLEKATEHAKNL